MLTVYLQDNHGNTVHEFEVKRGQVNTRSVILCNGKHYTFERKVHGADVYVFAFGELLEVSAKLG